MKTVTAFLLAALTTSVAAFSQSTTISVSYDRKDQTGLMLELPYNQEVSEGFIVANLKKTGYQPETKGNLFWKNNKVNGFYTFKGVKLDGYKNRMDLYFKVDRKSKKQIHESIIYLLVSDENQSFFTPDNEDVFKAAKRFLNGFLEQSALYKLDLDIESQENALSSAEKKMSKLKDEEKKLNEKIELLQNDLKKNLTDQEAQQKAIETEQKKLQELKAQKSA